MAEVVRGTYVSPVDVAPENSPSDVINKITVFGGGEFGSFSKQQRLKMVHLSLAEIDSFNERPWFMKICSASIALSMRIEKPKKS